MNGKFKKIVLNILLVIGIISIIIGVLADSLSGGDRALYIGLGAACCIMATIDVVRWAAIALLCFGIGCVSIPQIFDSKNYAISDILLCVIFFAIALNFGHKAFGKCRFPRPSKSAFLHNPSKSNDSIVITSHDDLNSFLESHILANEIRTKVVGVSFDNNDGTSRQENLSLCRRGEQVFFEHFEYNKSPAYAVYSEHGQIGNLSANLAATIDREYGGCVLYGTITEITGGYCDLYFGCSILIRVFREKSSSELAKAPNPEAVAFSPQGPSQLSPGRANIIDNIVKQPQRSSKPDVDYSFVAEAQWYASRDLSKSEGGE